MNKDKKLLIVDDEEDIVAIIKVGIEMTVNWVILTASSGQEALEIASQSEPDVILLDMMMPDMDGRMVIAKLKDNPYTQDIPIFLITAKAQQANIKNLNNLDVVAVIAKPFRPLEIASFISEKLNWELI